MQKLPVIALMLLVASSGFPDCAPPKLLRMVVQGEGPSTKGDSFAVKPKTIYRLGEKYARVEEQLDEKRHLEGLIIVSEPDSWLVNKVDMTGRHAIDTDTHQVVRLPLFQGTSAASLPAELQELELGCEVEFFDAHHSPALPFETPGGPMVKQAIGIAGWKWVLLRHDSKGRPQRIFLFHGNDIVFVMTYLSYDTITPDMSLFAQPRDVKLVENRPSN